MEFMVCSEKTGRENNSDASDLWSFAANHKEIFIIDGMEIAQMGAEYRRLLGYLPQELGYYDNFTAERFLRYIAALKAMSAECSEQKIQELLELVELQKDKKKSLELFQGECFGE